MSSHHYAVDEFLRHTTEDPKKVVISKKIRLLYDFCVLKRNDRKPDPLEHDVKIFLSQYDTERQMTIALHDVLCGKSDLRTTLKKAGVLS